MVALDVVEQTSIVQVGNERAEKPFDPTMAAAAAVAEALTGKMAPTPVPVPVLVLQDVSLDLQVDAMPRSIALLLSSSDFFDRYLLLHTRPRLPACSQRHYYPSRHTSASVVQHHHLAPMKYRVVTVDTGNTLLLL